VLTQKVPLIRSQYLNIYSSLATQHKLTASRIVLVYIMMWEEVAVIPARRDTATTIMDKTEPPMELDSSSEPESSAFASASSEPESPSAVPGGAEGGAVGGIAGGASNLGQ
jgi:hypothetical protein